MRSGNTYARSTNNELWGKDRGYNLILPSNIERIACKIPANTGLTTERFILENTIYPLLKPFISQERNRLLLELMTNYTGDSRPNTFAVTGLTWAKQQRKPYLSYCEQCIREDTEIYGEPYWHRTHQLPGVFICDKHHAMISKTDIFVNSLLCEYLSPVVFSGIKQKPEPPINTENLIKFSEDAAWLLRAGGSLGYYEGTTHLYDKWLRAKGFRMSDNKTQHKEIAAAITSAYSEEYLSRFDAFNSGTCKWAKSILQYPKKFHHPMYHILLMSFLASSVENFFLGHCENLDKQKTNSHKKPAMVSAVPLNEKREIYRHRWSKLLLENPIASRSELMLKDEKCHIWLKKNDKLWYEKTTPVAKNSFAKWADSDSELAEALIIASEKMRNDSGKPVWINITSVSKKAGIIGIHNKVATGRLPLTELALNEITETMEQWRCRKILWVIKTLHEHDITPTYNKVRKMAGIINEAALRLKDFIHTNIE
jgi:hypothetical protein